MGLVLLVRHGQASFGSDDYDVLSETGWEQGRALGRWLAEQGVVPTSVVRGDLRRHRETVEAIGEPVAEVRRRSLEASGGFETGPGGPPQPPGSVAEVRRRSLEASGGFETGPGGPPQPPGSVSVVVDGRWDEFDHEAVVAAYSETGTDAELADRRGFQAVFERATARWVGAEPGYEESFADFSARVVEALGDACDLAGSGRTVLVVTSGGPIAAVCAELTGGEWGRFNPVVVNTSVTRIVVGSTGARLLTFNEHVHLTPDLLTYR